MVITDTIAAVATPPGIGGIGIIRVSGPDAHRIGEHLTDSSLEKTVVQFRKFLDSKANALDHGLCLFSKSPHSFTGEDVIEIQGHGGPVLLDMLLERVCALGARLARAGEFSQRAFLNGKIDLTQAEAVADLIESGSRAAARAAMRSLEGKFSDAVNLLIDNLINLRVYVEAALDFAEEEIDFLADNAVRDKLESCIVGLEQLLAQAEQGSILRDGLSVAIAGLPNAGKSSLLNCLAGYDAAIVTDIAGTTRDVLRENISIRGIPVRMNDTAGLRDSDNPVEQEGVKRAWSEIGKADTVLFIIDAQAGITTLDQSIIDQLDPNNSHLVFNKSDLLGQDVKPNPDTLYISTLTGEGIEDLAELITGDLANFNQDNQAILGRRRHVDALTLARVSLNRAKQVFVETQSGELMAEDLRETQQHLNEITGEFTSDDLLGKIFSSFCIGK